MSPWAGGKMTLIEWMEWKNLTHEQFGRMCGCSRAAVTRWVTGSRLPSAKWWKVIERVTKGQVSLDVYDEMPVRTKVRFLIYRKGHSVSSAAKRIRINRNTLANYLNGVTLTPNNIVQRIHKFVGLT